MASTKERDRDVPAPALGTEEGGGESGSMSYEDLLGMYEESLKNLSEGEVVTGRVIDVTNNNVIVDVSGVGVRTQLDATFINPGKGGTLIVT